MQNSQSDAIEIYANGMVPKPIQPIINEYDKVGRNDKCPCGSKKKYKKCCLKAAIALQHGIRDEDNRLDLLDRVVTEGVNSLTIQERELVEDIIGESNEES